MKKFITVILVAFGLVVGGLVASAPAQAIVGSSVHFYEVSDGIPSDWIKLHNTGTGGTEYLQSFATTRGNVRESCPPNDNYYLYYTNPAGAFNRLNPGVCLVPIRTGTYSVGIARA
ncbi:hypothetical protein [Promicromonospora soli]|uniref:Lamin tail-like protein n=1 Tax=Promicromonospora soli TaxID=2035533 RepID=A0A919KV03_9MICO|nr:hypothetical protein [Promicromonospora soli]GHH73648.1 hypothetical protein GCM10017772_25780 [Promicromonospora soli]